jgi:uncharacterized protein YndB with AHSA1/START domain
VAVDLCLRRELFVPRELVFDAWTQEEHLVQWYSPRPQMPRASRLDARPGGRFVLAWEDADGATGVDEGEFVAISRPQGFVCTLGPPGHPAGRLEVKLIDLGGACRIDLRHEGFASAAARDERQRLWNALLDRLEGYFTVI